MEILAKYNAWEIAGVGVNQENQGKLYVQVLYKFVFTRLWTRTPIYGQVVNPKP